MNLVKYTGKLFSATLLMIVSSSAFSAVTYDSSAIASNLRDIRSTGTQFSLGDDSVTSAVSLGFSFDFYGNTFSSAYISSNGFITFDSSTSSGCCTGDVLGDGAGIGNLIAGLWEDLDTNNNSTGTMYYDVTGALGSQEFIVGFYDVSHWPNQNPVTFEMILNEGSNDIELQFGRLTDDGTHTIGVTNIGDTVAETWYRGTDIAQFSNTGVLFTGSAVPVPAPLALIGLGLLGMGITQRRKTA